MFTYDEFTTKVVEATKEVNQATADDENLLEVVCEEISDRLSLYLNLPADRAVKCFDGRLVRVAARIVSGIFTQTKANIDGNGVDTEVKSISDNGQSITYGESTKNYLATATDGELFGGCAELLKPFRRVHVVSR